MKNKHKILIRVGLFALIFLILFSAVNAFFQPVWLEWNNYYTTYGFYEEPRNTLETLFLGASISINGIIPTELYSDYGICSYNLSMEQQPVLSSYYWLEEVYRLHSKTLKSVVFDVSQLRATNTDAFYHKSLDAMKFSHVKFRAVYDHMEEDFYDTVSYLIPISTYHHRWTSLEATDFVKHSYDPVNGTRGYNFEIETYSGDYISHSKVIVKNPVVDQSAVKTPLQAESLEYFKKMVEFCEEKDIKLILMKTPANNWASSQHNAVANLADQYGLEFLDFNFGSLYDEISYVHAFDSTDGTHMNYYGATKLTDWIGKYLVENCGATDVRGNSKYDHMEEQLSEYQSTVIKSVELMEAESLTEFLDIALDGDNSIFITVKDEASTSLSSQEREYFTSISLNRLSNLAYRDSYIAMIDNGEVVYEYRKGENAANTSPITYNGELSDGKSFMISSGGYKHGNEVSCLIDESEYADNERGLNIVVYSNEYSTVIGSTSFDTYMGYSKDRYNLEMATNLYDESVAEKYSSSDIYKQVLDYQSKVNALKNGN